MITQTCKTKAGRLAPGIWRPAWRLRLLLLTATFSLPAWGQTYAINWHQVAGGGGTCTGGVYQISGTIGQHDASAAMTGGSYDMTGGFWSLLSARPAQSHHCSERDEQRASPLGQYRQLYPAANQESEFDQLGGHQLPHHHEFRHEFLHHHPAHGKPVLPPVQSLRRQPKKLLTNCAESKPLRYGGNRNPFFQTNRIATHRQTDIFTDSGRSSVQATLCLLGFCQLEPR